LIRIKKVRSRLEESSQLVFDLGAVAVTFAFAVLPLQRGVASSQFLIGVDNSDYQSHARHLSHINA